MRGFFRFAFLRLIPLYSEMLFLYCLFLLLSSSSAGVMMSFDFGRFFLCGLFFTLCFCFFSMRDQSLLSVCLLIAAFAAIAEVLMFPTLVNVSGFWGYLFSILIFLYPSIRCYMLTRREIDADMLLGYTELSIACVVGFFFTQLGPFSPGVALNALCLLALALNLLTLSALRISSAGQVRASAGERLQRGFILAVVILLLLALTLTMGLLLIPETQQAIWAALYATRDFFAAVGGAIGDFIMFLLSFLPDGDYGELEPLPEPIPMPGFEGESFDPDTSRVGYLLAIAAAAALAVGSFFLWKFRKLRIRRMGPGHIPIREARRPFPLFAILAAWLTRLRRAVSFRIRLISMRNSPPGVFIRLMRLGRKRDLPRREWQTPREYLSFLALRTASGDAEAGHAFSELADCLDLCFFAETPDNVSRRYPREKTRLLLRTAWESPPDRWRRKKSLRKAAAAARDAEQAARNAQEIERRKAARA